VKILKKIIYNHSPILLIASAFAFATIICAAINEFYKVPNLETIMVSLVTISLILYSYHCLVLKKRVNDFFTVSYSHFQKMHYVNMSVASKKVNKYEVCPFKEFNAAKKKMIKNLPKGNFRAVTHQAIIDTIIKDVDPDVNTHNNEVVAKTKLSKLQKNFKSKACKDCQIKHCPKNGNDSIEVDMMCVDFINK